MQSAMIGFIIGSIFTALAAYYFATIVIKSRVKEMISDEAEKRIKDLEFDNCFLEKKLNIAVRERDIAIEDSKLTLKERNEALIMLSNKFKQYDS